MNGSPSWLDRLVLLAKYRKFFMRWLLLWLIVGVVAAYVWPPRYRATCSFLPPTEESSGFLGSLGSSLKLSNVSDIEGTGFSAIIRSARLKDSIDVQFDLRRRYGQKKIDLAYNDFDGNLEILTETEEGLGLSRIHAFYVRVTDKSPEDAAAMANTVVKFADRITAELTSQRQRLTREFLENRVSDSKESLRVAEDSLRSFSQRTGIVAPEAQIEATIKALAGVEEQIAGSEVELHVAMTTFGAQHPNVRTIQAKLNELETQRDRLSGKIEQTVSMNLIALKQSPLLSLEYARRYRDVRTHEVLMGFLIQQLEQARIGELRNAPVLRVLDQAKPPESRRWPIRSVVVMLSMFLGVFSGFLWIGWCEWFDSIVNTDFDVKLRLALRQYTPKMLWKSFIGNKE